MLCLGPKKTQCISTPNLIPVLYPLFRWTFLCLVFKSMEKWGRKNLNIRKSYAIHFWVDLEMDKTGYQNSKIISDSIFVRIGLYHGTESLSEVLETKQITYSTNHNLRWDEWLEFDISQPDLPNAAKLCLSICSVKKRKNRSETTMLFWYVFNKVLGYGIGAGDIAVSLNPAMTLSLNFLVFSCRSVW